ncbi:hypothetical protein MHYP_G00308700 [Metynnis hypsauchen]
MDKKPCGSGQRWDGLVKDCIHKETQPVTVVNTLAVLRTKAPASSWTAFSPSLWICVGVILSISVLALLLLFIIYRRHTHNTGKRHSKPAAPLQLNGNTGPVLPEQREDPPLSCPHWNGKAEEVSVCEMGWGRGICEGKMEHGVPVPATELGDSALVTTKTVQQAEA